MTTNLLHRPGRLPPASREGAGPIYARTFRDRLGAEALDDDLVRFGPSFDLTLGLVAGRSAITCIVISRILARAGLRTITETPERAPEQLLARRPCVIVADGGIYNDDCRDLVEAVAGLRRATGTGLPVLVVLTATNTHPARVDPGGTVNAVVAKPITPEALQPIVEILLDPFRG